MKWTWLRFCCGLADSSDIDKPASIIDNEDTDNEVSCEKNALGFSASAAMFVLMSRTVTAAAAYWSTCCHPAANSLRRVPIIFATPLSRHFAKRLAAVLSLLCDCLLWCRFATGRYASFTAAFKLRAVDYALQHGNRAAGRHFDVDEVHIRHWKNQREKLTATNKTRRAFRGPKTGKFPEVEEVAPEYVRDLRKDGCAVSLEMIQSQARTVARKMGIVTTDFHASSGWKTRFM